MSTPVGFAPLTPGGEGMWACVRIEPARFNFVRHRALGNAQLLFLQVSAPGEYTATHGRRHLAAALRTMI